MPVIRKHILLVNPVIRRILLIGIAVRVLLFQNAPDPDIDRESIDMMQSEKGDTICHL